MRLYWKIKKSLSSVRLRRMSISVCPRRYACCGGTGSPLFLLRELLCLLRMLPPTCLVLRCLKISRARLPVYYIALSVIIFRWVLPTSSLSFSFVRTAQTVVVTWVCCICFLVRAAFWAYRPLTGKYMQQEMYNFFSSAVLHQHGVGCGWDW